MLGRGLPIDKEKAFYWCSKAAVQGNKFAQTRLAHFYNLGIGVLQDDRLTLYWLSKAIAQGHDEARFKIARFKSRNSKKK